MGGVMRVFRHFIVALGCCLLFGWAALSQAETAALREVGEKERCPVCGMFVAKYTSWLSQVQLTDGRVFTFDGVKDMLAFHFSPAAYGAEGQQVTEIRVKDYYSQQWIDGRAAFYVVGSDVLGPMGHELIPFGKRDEAATFMNDHHGKELLEFSQIAAELVEKLRQGHKMKGHMHGQHHG